MTTIVNKLYQINSNIKKKNQVLIIIMPIQKRKRLHMIQKKPISSIMILNKSRNS